MRVPCKVISKVNAKILVRRTLDNGLAVYCVSKRERTMSMCEGN